MKTQERPWVAVEYGILFRMVKFGKTDKQIAGILGRTEKDVWRFRKALGAEPDAPPAEKDLPQVATGKPAKIYKAQELLALAPVTPNCSWERKAKASTAFLISMLRAGHTPGQGEYAMTSEARCVSYAVDTSRYSIMGSQAAMCLGA